MCVIVACFISLAQETHLTSASQMPFQAPDNLSSPQQEQRKKDEMAGSKKSFRMEPSSSSRDSIMSQFPHGPNSQKFHPPLPHPSQIHGHQRDTYSHPNKRHFNHAGK